MHKFWNFSKFSKTFPGYLNFLIQAFKIEEFIILKSSKRISEFFQIFNIVDFQINK